MGSPTRRPSSLEGVYSEESETDLGSQREATRGAVHPAGSMKNEDAFLQNWYERATDP
jgi:hypothetical protein